MSEITRGVIGMPFDMAMESELSRRQFHSIAQELLQDFGRVTAERDGLQLALNTADQTIDDLQIAIGRRNQRIDELTTQQAEAVDLLKYLKDEREYPDDFEKRLKAATQQQLPPPSKSATFA